MKRWGLINEQDTKHAITALLSSRGLGEGLREMDVDKIDDFPNYIDFMSTRVRALIGVHGSKLMNHIFAAKDTLVVEIIPPAKYGDAFFVYTQALEQIYAPVLIETGEVGEAHEDDAVTVKVENVIIQLANNFGKTADDLGGKRIVKLTSEEERALFPEGDTQATQQQPLFWY